MPGKPENPDALLKALKGESQAIPPIWLMRQAGRYLPEYRALRAKAGSFLELCFNPELAAEVTIQPIRRFDFDAAIIFADILLIPHAFGQNLTFVEGEGPRLGPPVSAADLKEFRSRNIHAALAPVYNTVERVRAALPPDKAVIGFAGAPWTVATYMLAGGPADDPSALRRRWYDETSFVNDLISLIADATVEYLSAQIAAGAGAVQLFDSWAGGLPEEIARAVSLTPLQAICEKLKARHPQTPIILFPKGVGTLAADYAKIEGCDAISIDTSTSWKFAREKLAPHAVVQGGLDPMLVVKGGAAMEEGAQQLCEAFAGLPYIFNLGHGLTPDTPPDHVARLVEIVRREG